MVPAACCVCDQRDAEPVGVGEDFELRTSPDTFLVMQCKRCGVVYLDRRPAPAERSVIYPEGCRGTDGGSDAGLVARIRNRRDARRLLSACRDLPSHAAILIVGCGDGLPIQPLRDFGAPTWQLEGIDTDPRAAEAGPRAGIHCDPIDACGLQANHYDLAILLQTIQQVENPRRLLEQIRALLRPGGRLMLVTSNTGTLDFRLFKGSHWGGYHFPRRWYLFDRAALIRLAIAAGFAVDSVTTIASPDDWIASVRNALDDWQAPSWLQRRFTRSSPAAFVFFTALDTLHQWAGRGAQLRAMLRKPAGPA